jgi:hypothetical protein
MRLQPSSAIPDLVPLDVDAGSRRYRGARANRAQKHPVCVRRTVSWQCATRPGQLTSSAVFHRRLLSSVRRALVREQCGSGSPRGAGHKRSRRDERVRGAAANVGRQRGRRRPRRTAACGRASFCIRCLRSAPLRSSAARHARGRGERRFHRLRYDAYKDGWSHGRRALSRRPAYSVTDLLVKVEGECRLDGSAVQLCELIESAAW